MVVEEGDQSSKKRTCIINIHINTSRLCIILFIILLEIKTDV